MHNSESLVRQSFEFQIQRPSRIQISVIEENPTSRSIISTPTVRTSREDVSQQSTLHSEAVVVTSAAATSSAPPSYGDCVGCPPTLEASNTSKPQRSPLPTYREYVTRNLYHCKSCVTARSTARMPASLSHDRNFSRPSTVYSNTAFTPRTATAMVCLTPQMTSNRPHRERVFHHPLMNEGPTISAPTPSTSTLPTYAECLAGSRFHGNSPLTTPLSLVML